MTNREKYAEQILNVACSGNSLAMDKEKNITSCESIECDECEFFGEDTTWCGKNIKKWADSEYVEKAKISESDRRLLEYIPITERFPDPDEYILVSFENFSIPMIGRYTVDDDGGGTFRIGDDDETFLENDLIVNAWMPLPKAYRSELE